MQAATQNTYGAPKDLIEILEHPKPVPKPTEVLVKVVASSVQGDDYHLLAGYPLIIRLDNGLKKPKQKIVGLDFAGVVAEVGSKVTTWKAGDPVVGFGKGATAEFVAVPAKDLVRKPDNVSFAEAGVLAMAGLTAYQSVRAAKLSKGQHLLIEGASGGVGTYAIQFAKADGLVVTAVCSGKNAELCKSLGADHVIDYTTTEWTDNGEKYDAIIELVAKNKLGKVRKSLAKKGRLVMTGGPGWGTFGPIGRWLRAMTTSMFVSQSMKPMVHSDSPEDMAAMLALMEEGKVKSVITATYPLADVKAAHASFEGGHCTGLVSVSVQDP